MNLFEPVSLQQGSHTVSALHCDLLVVHNACLGAVIIYIMNTLDHMNMHNCCYVYMQDLKGDIIVNLSIT